MNANRVTPTLTLLAGLFMAFALTGCGNSGSATSLNDAPQAREAPKTSQEFANHIVHFNAITSDQVSPENAAKYGISRSRSNALLNVVILAKQDGGGPKPGRCDLLHRRCAGRKQRNPQLRNHRDTGRIDRSVAGQIPATVFYQVTTSS